MKKLADRLVVVATFLEPNQADIARLRLETEGVRAALDGENHIAMDWFISNAIGGVKLLVHERDLDSARRILQTTATGISDEQTGDETDREASLERCPACNSDDIYRERLKRRLIFLSILLLGIPIPFVCAKWCVRIVVTDGGRLEVTIGKPSPKYTRPDEQSDARERRSRADSQWTINRRRPVIGDVRRTDQRIHGRRIRIAEARRRRNGNGSFPCAAVRAATRN